MVLVFIKCTDPFAVNYKYFEGWLSALSLDFDRLAPNPQTFRAWIDGWAHTEPAVVSLIKDNSIQKERLPRSILASNSNDTNFLFDLAQHFPCLLADMETLLLIVHY
jgi:hypothetical protein